MDGHELPLAIGVIRDVEAPSYEAGVEAQVQTVKAKKGFTSLRDTIIKTAETGQSENRKIRNLESTQLWNRH